MVAQRKPLPLERFILQFLNDALNRVPLCQKVINSKVTFWADSDGKLKLNHNSRPEILKRAPLHQSSFSFHEKIIK